MLYLHIITGSVALLTGLLALVLRKGSVAHKRMGDMFFGAMLLCSGAGLWLALNGGNQFLLVIAVFSLYLTLAGFSALFVLKSPVARILGQLLASVMAFGVVGFVVLASDAFQNGNVLAGFLLTLFGALAGFLVVQDYRFFRHGRGSVMSQHIGRMVGAWIAALSAFLVVNQTLQPPVLNWVAPLVIGVPMIVFWIRRFTRP